MRILIAPDSFKGSLTATEAARAMGNGVKRVCPHWETDEMPIADGGEGTLDALVTASGGTYIETEVHDPRGLKRQACFGVLGDGVTAIVEMAQASGITLVPTAELNPLTLTSYGAGELIRAALDNGYRRLIVALGGSATVDGGLGALTALGARLLDSEANEIPAGGQGLHAVHHIDLASFDERLKASEIIIASDVTNPLCGPKGAALVFGPQKGANPAMVDMLVHGLEHWAAVIERQTGVDVRYVPGAGAAGGLGAALIAFARAQVKSGVDVVLQALQAEKRLRQSTLVLTGEGRIDSQTVDGKAPIGLALQAQAQGCPVIALVGSLGEGYQAVFEKGIDTVFALADSPTDLTRAQAEAFQLLEGCAERVMRLVSRLTNYTSKGVHMK